MRIHKLRLRGVGPFVSEFAIDFDELGARKLFLIEGVTGAGKSTIIDAIVFALYGHTSEASAKSRMVSHFIGDDVPKNARPFVELVFSVESGVYRVFREPEAEYINRNGKLDTRTSTVRLERLASEVSEHGELITNRIQEGSREIEQKVGLDPQQFHATIVLAQGKFARFLKATSEDRQRILEKVFGTQDYAAAQKYLDTQAKEARGQRRDEEIKLRNAVSRFLQAAGVDDPDDEWPARMLDEPEEAMNQADDLVAEFEVAAAEAAKRAEAAKGVLESAQEVDNAARSLDKLVTQKRQLLATRAELERQSGAIERLRAALERHRQARAVVPAMDTLDQATSALTTARESWESARGGLDSGDSYLQDLPASEQPAAIKTALESIAEERGGMADALQVEGKLVEQQRAVTAAEEALARRTAEVKKFDDRKRTLPADISTRRAELAQLETDAQPVEAIEEKLEQLKVGAEAAEEVGDLNDEHEAAVREATKCNDEWETANEALRQLERRFTNSLAAQVARELVDGDPCPVCGSVEHPQPAASGDSVSQEQVQQARDEVDQLRLELDQARGAVNKVDLALATAQARAQNKTQQEWGAALSTATQELDNAHAVSKRVAAVKEKITQLEQESDTLHESYTQSVKSQEQAEGKLGTAKELLASSEARVASARGDYESVAGRLEALDQRREKLQLADSAQKELQQAHTNVAQAETGLNASLKDNGFTDVAECRNALLAEQDVPMWQSDVKTFDDNQAAVTRDLAKPELADLDPDTEVDLAGPAERLQNAKTAHEEAVGVKRTKTDDVVEVSSARDGLADAKTHYLAIHERTADVIRIADLAAGGTGNLRGIPLATYVVLRRFEEVVAAANDRLSVISDGRYRLQTDIDKRDGRKVVRGLGLSILDGETDKTRGVDTLSGGETFYTSLSLALGLADVVQAEAGGVQLGTLFIDEGFGSLDGDTLDAVMAVLHQLTRGDRVVGVISHVEEMKRAIPDRVHVRRKDDGTSVIEVPD